MKPSSILCSNAVRLFSSKGRQQKAAEKTLARKLIPLARQFLASQKTAQANRRALDLSKAFNHPCRTAIITRGRASFSHALPDALRAVELSGDEIKRMRFAKSAAGGDKTLSYLKEQGFSDQSIKAIEAKTFDQRIARRQLLERVPEEYQKHFALIGEDQFDAALKDSVDQFIQAVGNKPYRVIVSSANKSDAWVLGKLLKHSQTFQPQGESGVAQPLVTNLTEYERFTQEALLKSVDEIDEQTGLGSFVRQMRGYEKSVFSAFKQKQADLVVVDDAAYSGEQLFSRRFSVLDDSLSRLANIRQNGEIFKKMRNLFGKPPRLTVHVVVPFTSAKARALFKECASRWKYAFDLKLHTSGHIAHASEVKNMPECIEHLTLFAHKVADEKSLGSKVALRETGSIATYRTNAAEKWSWDKRIPRWPSKEAPFVQAPERQKSLKWAFKSERIEI